MLVNGVDELGELDIALGQTLDIMGSQGNLNAVVDLMCRGRAMISLQLHFQSKKKKKLSSHHS